MECRKLVLCQNIERGGESRPFEVTGVDFAGPFLYNTIQILLSTPRGGFSETNINTTGNQKDKQTKKEKYSRIVNKQLSRNYLHIEFMTSQIDYQ